MKKSAVFFLVLLLGLTTATADLPRIAVYVTGDVGENEKSALGTRMLASLVNSGQYRGIERSATFLAEVEKEQVKQRSGSVDDSQISELGKQFGVKYICIAAITPAFGSYQVSARIVNVETAEVAFVGEAYSSLRSTRSMTQVSDEVVHAMFYGQTKPAVPPSALQAKFAEKPAFWTAIGLDIIGAGIIAYGIFENENVISFDDKGDLLQAEKSAKNRNIAYTVGAFVLATGVFFHIYF